MSARDGGIPQHPAWQLDRVPAALRDRAQWLVWRFEQGERDKKPRKVPYYTSGSRRSGDQGSEADRAALVNLDVAQRAMREKGYSGVGIAFLPNDALVGIDLDGVIDLETGEVQQRALEIVAACASFTEVSPSGAGLHIYVTGAALSKEQGGAISGRSNDIGLEVYAGRQFFCVTGNHWPGTPEDVRPIDDKVLRRLLATIEQAKASRHGTRQVPAPSDQGERALIDSALAVVSADLPYNDWIAVGMAIYDTLGEGAFGVWDYWSEKGAKYPGQKGLRGHWRSFAGRPPGGAGVIFTLAKATGWRRPGLHNQVAPEPSMPTPDAGAAQRAKPAEAGPPTSWPKPVMFGAGPDLADLPAGLAPDPLGNYAEAVAYELQVPLMLPLLLMLAVCATAVQRRYAVRPYHESTYYEPLSLFAMVMLPPANRKSEALKRAVEPLGVWERVADRKMRRAIERLADEALVLEKRVSRLRELLASCDDDNQAATLRRELDEIRETEPAQLARPKLFVGDSTPEQLESRTAEQRGRMGLFSDEGGTLATMTGAYSGGEARLDVLLVGHAGGNLRIDRRGRQVSVERSALSMGLTIQPEILVEMKEPARSRLRYSGMLSRVMLGLPPNNLGRRDVRRNAPASHALRDAYVDTIMSLLESPEEIIEAVSNPPETDDPVMLTLSSAACETWLQYQERLEPRLADGGELENLRDWAGKAPGLAMRIAGVFHCVAHGVAQLDVGDDCMRRAVRLVEFLEPHARAFLESLGVDQATSDAQRIAGHIRRQSKSGHLSKTELTQTTKGAVSGARLDRAIIVLQDRAILGRAESVETGGRKKTVYEVNPRFLSTP